MFKVEIEVLQDTTVMAQAVIKQSGNTHTYVTTGHMDKVTGTVNWLNEEGASSTTTSLNDILLETYSVEELFLRAYLNV